MNCPAYRPRSAPSLALIAAVAIVTTLVALPQAAGITLNDTGQTSCYNSAGLISPCGGGGQDARYGRDAAAAAGVLVKTGGGVAGFDFTKVANNGTNLPANATLGLGTNPTDWACTRDNATGLMWEMKSVFNASLRYAGNTYTWMSASNNGGNPGSVGSDTCNGSLVNYSNQCNTANYVLAINAAALCGHNDWRLPGARELESLTYLENSSTAIDVNYFPDVKLSAYWTATNESADPTHALGVLFSSGLTVSDLKGNANFVRLVRGTP